MKACRLPKRGGGRSLAFGAVEGYREAMRDERGARWFDDLRADVRYAVKGMRRNPGFILAVTLTLGLGIGVNGIVFGYVNTILFRPVPAQAPEELVALFTRDTKTGQTGAFGYDDFIDFRDRSGAFAGVAAMTGAPVNLVVPQTAGNATGDMVWAEIVTEDFFSLLGARPAVGRFFTAADAPQGGNPFLVLSYDAWQRRFQGDPNVAGRAIRINGSEFVVTGVAPRGFKGMRRLGFWPEVWVPIGMQPVVQPGAPGLLHGRGGGPLLVVGRLRPGFDLERTQAVAADFARQLEAAYPASNTNVGVSLLPAKVGFENPAIIKPRILVLSSALGIVGSLTVLLIICANLAVLQLARTASRAREIAIRLSLGCSRGRLTRQLLVESLLVAAPGAALGVAAMRLASPLEPYLTPKLPFQVGFGPTADIRVMFFTGAIAVASVVFFGVIPAVRAGRSRLVPSSASGLGLGRSDAGRPSRTRNVLVVSQLALSVILLIAASLFVRSLKMADTVSLGFEPRNRVLVSMNVGLQGYDQARGLRFYDEVLRRTRLASRRPRGELCVSRAIRHQRSRRTPLRRRPGEFQGRNLRRAGDLRGRRVRTGARRTAPGRPRLYAARRCRGAPRHDCQRLPRGSPVAGEERGRSAGALRQRVRTGSHSRRRDRRREVRSRRGRHHQTSLSATEAALSRLGNTRRPHARHSRSDALPSS